MSADQNLEPTGPVPPRCTAGHTVAVVIAAHDAAAFIGRAVCSALAQAETSEVIVIDDASSDDTARVATAADDGSGRLRILRQPVNLGPAGARNRGIATSTSAWIAPLDADDYLLPGRLSALLRHADDADFIADDPLRGYDDAIVGATEPVLGIETATRLSFAGFVRGNISRAGRPRCELGYLKPLMRRAFLEQHTLAYDESMRLAEDYELYARALACGARFLALPARGYVSVWRDNSLSARHSTVDLERYRDCDTALASRQGLSKEDRDALRLHFTSIECRVRWRHLLDDVRAWRLLRAASRFVGPWQVPVHLLRLSLWRLRVILRLESDRPRRLPGC